LEETLFQKGFFQEDFFCPATIYLETYICPLAFALRAFCVLPFALWLFEGAIIFPLDFKMQKMVKNNYASFSFHLSIHFGSADLYHMSGLCCQTHHLSRGSPISKRSPRWFRVPSPSHAGGSRLLVWGRFSGPKDCKR